MSQPAALSPQELRLLQELMILEAERQALSPSWATPSLSESYAEAQASGALLHLWDEEIFALYAARLAAQAERFLAQEALQHLYL